MKLSVTLIQRIHRRLLKRHREKGDKGVLAVGIGWAFKNGQLDASRGMCLLYLVRRKRKKMPVSWRIPSEVTVFLTHHHRGRSRRQRANFATDVIETKVARHTGLEMDGGTEVFTGGTLINWNDPMTGLRWGLLSVSHAVANKKVQIQAPGGQAFYGTVYAETSAGSVLDAVLIEIDQADLASNLGRFLQAPGSPVPICRSVDELFEDGSSTHPAGKSLTSESDRPFKIYGYFPAQQPGNPLIGEAPNRTHLVLAIGQNQTFEPGTSGSVWIASGGIVDAIQIAGFPETFARGIGQPMADYLAWAEKQVGCPINVVSVF